MLTNDSCSLLAYIKAGIPAYKFVRLYDIDVLKYYDQFAVYMRRKYRFKSILSCHAYYKLINNDNNLLSKIWAHTDKPDNDITDASVAAYNGHLEFLKWLNTANEYAYDAAAIGGHYDVIRWLETIIKSIPKYIIHSAIKCGHLYIVKKLNINTLQTLKYAILSNNQEIAEYIINNITRLLHRDLLTMAVHVSDLYIIKLIYAKTDLNYITPISMSKMLNKNLKLIHWVHLHIGLTCVDETLEQAMHIKGNIDVVKYIYANFDNKWKINSMHFDDPYINAWYKINSH